MTEVEAGIVNGCIFYKISATNPLIHLQFAGTSYTASTVNYPLAMSGGR